MDFAMTDEQRLIVEQVRRFVREEVIPLEQARSRRAGSTQTTKHAWSRK